MIASAGNVTIAIFLYEEPFDVVRKMDYRLAGFDAGEGNRSHMVLDMHEFTLNLEKRNLYRIDGVFNYDRLCMYNIDGKLYISYDCVN